MERTVSPVHAVAAFSNVDGLLQADETCFVLVVRNQIGMMAAFIKYH